MQKLPGLRLHVRAMIRDGETAFVGSQSLRALELDARREVGLIVKEPKTVKRILEVFEEDWAKTRPGREGSEGSKERDQGAEEAGGAFRSRRSRGSLRADFKSSALQAVPPGLTIFCFCSTDVVTSCHPGGSIGCRLRASAHLGILAVFLQFDLRPQEESS